MQLYVHNETPMYIRSKIKATLFFRNIRHKPDSITSFLKIKIASHNILLVIIGKLLSRDINYIGKIKLEKLDRKYTLAIVR